MRHHSFEYFKLFCEIWKLIISNVTHTHRPAKDDQQPHFIQIGRHFIARVKMPGFNRNPEVPEDRDDSAGAFVLNMLEDNRFAHKVMAMIGSHGWMSSQNE